VLDISKLPRPRKLQQIINNLTSEELKILQPKIIEADAEIRRLLRGKRRTKKSKANR